MATLKANGKEVARLKFTTRGRRAPDEPQYDLVVSIRDNGWVLSKLSVGRQRFHWQRDARYNGCFAAEAVLQDVPKLIKGVIRWYGLRGYALVKTEA